jgi:prefoldin subunit 5
MKKLIVFVIGYIMMLGIYSKEIPYTLEDRERLIRLEEGLNSVNQRIDILEKSLNQRIDGLEKSLNRRIDDIYQLMVVLIGAIIAQIIGVIGFVLWDRRTAITPVIKRTRELEEENEKIYKVLKEMGKRDTKIAQILKQVGIL